MTQRDQLPKGYIPCSECSGTSGNNRTYDYVRGTHSNIWCPRCDGDQRVYVGTRTADLYWGDASHTAPCDNTTHTNQ